jgi:hypothetical protein
MDVPPSETVEASEDSTNNNLNVDVLPILLRQWQSGGEEWQAIKEGAKEAMLSPRRNFVAIQHHHSLYFLSLPPLPDSSSIEANGWSTNNEKLIIPKTLSHFQFTTQK